MRCDAILSLVFFNRIHPRYKEEVADRCARGAFAVYYKQPDAFQGPYPISSILSGLNVEVVFTQNLDVRRPDKSGFEVS